MFLKIGRGLAPMAGARLIDISPKTAAVFGDSISLGNIQTSGVQRAHESVGYLTNYNVLSKNRMHFPNANNLGVSGNSTIDMNTRKTDLAALTFDICFVMGGTNDIAAKYSVSTITTNLGAIYDYICNTLGKTVIALTILPRSSWGALNAGEIVTAKANINTVNAWIMAQHGTRGGKVISINLFTHFSNGSDEALSGATYDGLHPSPYGGMINGMDIYNRLLPYYGNGTLPNFTTGNLLTNGTLTGTGGTISTNFSGSVANNFTAVGFGGTNGRTASKNGDGSQRLTMSVTSGGGTDSIRLTQSISSGFTVGDKVYGQALVQIIGTPANIYSNALQLRLTGSSLPVITTAIGLDRRNNDTFIPETYMTVSPGKYLIQTIDLDISSGTSLALEWRYEMLGISTSTPCAGTIDIFGAGLYKR